MYVCMYVCICVYIYTHIRMYIYKCINMCIYVYIYILVYKATFGLSGDMSECVWIHFTKQLITGCERLIPAVLVLDVCPRSMAPFPVKPWPVILRFWVRNSWSSKIPWPKQRLWELPLQIWWKTIKTKSKESKLFLHCPCGVGNGSWIYQHVLIQWIRVRLPTETQSSYQDCQIIIQVLWGLWWFASVAQSSTAVVHSRLHGTLNLGFRSLPWMWNINHSTSFSILILKHKTFLNTSSGFALQKVV